MPEPVIVAASRSPIGRAYKGSLVTMRADDLAAQIVSAVLAQIPQLDPHEIEDIMLGCALPGGEQGSNLARVIAVMLGLDDVPGTTVNRFCASSLQTSRMAAHAIRAGEGDVFLSAGVDVVSRIADDNPDGPRYRNPMFDSALPPRSPWTDPRDVERIPDAYISMAETAENVASIHGIRRGDMDAFAFESQMKAKAALESGFWDDDITPVTLPDGTLVSADDGLRPTTTMEGLSGLSPAFRQDGLITAGNACGINDGAAAVVVMSDLRARQLGITPLARIVATAVSGVSPETMGLGPIIATRKVLSRAGMSTSDIDQFEINEAFAAQVLPCQRELGIPDEKLNVNGGAIAVGHPYGMTGARITTTLIHSLRNRDQQFGLETMCVAGGMGMAMIVERLS
jgi:acetyl-CoA C-acetyltransferase